MADSLKGQKEKILLVIGDQTFGDRLTESLRNAGYVASLITSGSQAIQAITDQMPHLVLLDIILPGMDGYEILEHKEADPLLAKIPVFLISTQGTPINMRRVPPGSVSEFIVALHAEPKEVVAKVDQQFGRSAANMEPVKVSGDQKTVLWVEDDRLIGNILGKKLTTSGFNLLRTQNGEEALRQLETTTPDIILIDLLLPGMSGFDILQSIRSNAKMKNVPIIILSNLSKPSDIEKAKQLGAQKFMVKATASLDQIVSEVRSLAK